MGNTSDDLLDRYLSGEASPEDERALVQAALDDPELFDLLTTAGLVQGALQAGDVESRATIVKRWPPRRKTLLYGAGLAAAAVAALVIVSVVRTPGPSAGEPTPPGAATNNQQPTAVALNAPPPVFLSALLAGGTTTAPEFRSAHGTDRLPKPEGSITTLEAGVAEVDLGAVDGLSNGSVLTVVSSSPVIRLVVTRVFRDRARGEVKGGGSVSAGDRVRVENADRLLALSEQIGAFLTRGDARTAQLLGSQALPLAQIATLPADARRAALTQLGALAHQSGDINAAERHLDAAAQTFETRPVASPAERAEVWNAIGQIAAAGGDLARAEEALLLAQSSAPPAGGILVEVTNNLGAVAVLRGDRARAERFYQTAQTLADRVPAQSSRQTVDLNLANLRKVQ